MKLSGRANDDIPWAAQDELYAELANVSNVAALSPQERAVYDENLKQYRDNIAAFLAARQEGLEQGLEQVRSEIARKMLAEGLDKQLISKMTNLTVDEIEALK